MAVIGQAFSPGFLQLVTSVNEKQKDRNLQAAIADRELRLRRDQIRAASKAQGQNAAFERQRAAVGARSAKAQLELIKEQGRNERNTQNNTLKRELAEEQQRLREKDSESKAAKRSAETDRILQKLGQSEVLFPTVVEGAQADVVKTKADAVLSEQKTKKVLSEIAANNEKLARAKIDGPLRSELIRKNIDHYAALTGNVAFKQKMAKQSKAFEAALKLKDRRLAHAKAFAAVNEMLSEFDIYNQSFEDRAEKSPAAAAALAGLKAIQKEYMAQFEGRRGRHPEFEPAIQKFLELGVRDAEAEDNRNPDGSPVALPPAAAAPSAPPPAPRPQFQGSVDDRAGNPFGN